MHDQHGLTLVDIAVALVIIGLLLGGVLKGRDLIRGAASPPAASSLYAPAASSKLPHGVVYGETASKTTGSGLLRPRA